MTDELSSVPVVGDFRQRGIAMTRVETFTDAAFAFALTMLVISFDQVPSTMEELKAALKNIPAFAASFAQIAMFWYAHHKWSRRYGLDDSLTAVLSLLLVFVTLIYVFPLRLVFSAFFAWITNGWLPFEMQDFSASIIGDLFVIYGLGFVAMSAVIGLHYVHAQRSAHELPLNEKERFLTRAEFQGWVIMFCTGAVSTLIAWLVPGPYNAAAGMAYATLAITMPAFGFLKDRQYRALFP